MNDLPGGGLLKLDDPLSNGVLWSLRYSGLTDSERQAIEEFFLKVEGRLRRFVFIDPCANLLKWSEGLDQSSWNRDGLLQITSGQLDERGTETAWRLTNAAQIAQGLRQSIEAPGWFTYCFGVLVKGASSGRITLKIAGSGSSLSSSFPVTSAWRLCCCSGTLATEDSEFTCALELESGMTVDISSALLCAQPAPGNYERTTSNNGVYPESRFRDDSLQFVSAGIDDHSVVVRIMSRQSVQA
ncbi:MAG TPA: hypothetical protein VEQ63_11885 [Bryobacteraceae bacterium]|nr:hypothetical protein [Bryobacteraceae bacterium]